MSELASYAWSRVMRQEVHKGEMATMHFPQWKCACVASAQFNGTCSSLIAPQRAVSMCENCNCSTCTQHCMPCEVLLLTGCSIADQQQPDKELIVERNTHWSYAGTWFVDLHLNPKKHLVVADLRPRPPRNTEGHGERLVHFFSESWLRLDSCVSS